MLINDFFKKNNVKNNKIFVFISGKFLISPGFGDC